MRYLYKPEHELTEIERLYKALYEDLMEVPSGTTVKLPQGVLFDLRAEESLRFIHLLETAIPKKCFTFMTDKGCIFLEGV